MKNEDYKQFVKRRQKLRKFLRTGSLPDKSTNANIGNSRAPQTPSKGHHPREEETELRRKSKIYINKLSAMDSKVEQYISQPSDRQSVLADIHSIILREDKAVAPVVEPMTGKKMIIYKSKSSMKYALAGVKKYMSLHLLPMYISKPLFSKYESPSSRGWCPSPSNKLIKVR